MIQLNQLVISIMLGSAEICPGLELPSKIDLEAVNAMVTQIPKSEHGRLFKAEHLSDSKEMDLEQLLHGSGYGVRLSFGTDACGVVNIYVFVLGDGSWTLESHITRSAPNICTAPGVGICDL